MIFNDINVKIVFVGVGEEYISDTSVSDCWAEDGDIIFIAPIINTLFIIDLFT